MVGVSAGTSNGNVGVTLYNSVEHKEDRGDGPDGAAAMELTTMTIINPQNKTTTGCITGGGSSRSIDIGSIRSSSIVLPGNRSGTGGLQDDHLAVDKSYLIDTTSAQKSK